MVLRHLALGSMIVALTVAGCSDKDGGTTAPNSGSPPGATNGASGVDSEISRRNQIVWGPAPPLFPAGAQFAVVEGDPSKAGGATEVQVHGLGPFALTYVHPQDDPTK
jgi:hypothetical protein